MSNINLKNSYRVLLFGIVGLLSACHKNPLINEDSINHVKQGRMLNDDQQFPFVICSKYYAGDGKSTDKEKCDKWSENQYKESMNFGDIPSTTTLDDYRDKNFWKAVEPK